MRESESLKLTWQISFVNVITVYTKVNNCMGAVADISYDKLPK